MLFFVSLSLAGVDADRAAGSGVGAPSGPTEVVGLAVSSLDFLDEGERSVVVIGLTEATEYGVEVQGTTVTVVIPGASVPSSLQRDLPTADFGAAVLGVQARADRDGARVYIQLASASQPSVTVEQGRLLRVAFENPVRILSEPEVLAVVVDTSERIEGHYTTEVLIGAYGEVSDPGVTLGGVPDGALVLGGMYSGGLAAAAQATGVGLTTGGSWSSGGRSIQGSTAATINLDLVDADIHNVLRLIADVSGLNFVASDDVSGSVTVRMVDVPWDLALAAILTSKGLGATVSGNIVQVMPLGL